MPTKVNSHGEQQNYVPAGHGDASGEYGDNESGSNKHIQFKKFNKPSTSKKVKLRKVIDDLGISTYYSENDEDDVRQWDNINKWYNENDRYKNEGWKLVEKEIEYDEDKIKDNLANFIEEKINKDEYINKFRLIADYKATLNEDERDEFEYFYKNEKNKGFINEEIENVLTQKQSKQYQIDIEAGKTALSKLPKIEGELSVDENVGLVNKANYDRTKNDYWGNKREWEKYHANCQKCVQAFELRMRGYNVEALERPSNRSKAYDTLNKAGWDMAMYIPKKNETFEAYGSRWVFGDKIKDLKETKPLSNARSLSQKEDIERIVKETGKGSRFQCSIAWKGGGAHVFSIINDNGVVRFIDSQNGSLDVSSYFDSGRIKPKDTMLIRVDNLEINGNVDMVAKGR